MTTFYVSQENDPGYALHELASAIERVKKFAAVRYYGDSVALTSAAIMVNSLSKDLTSLANEVVALHETRRHLDAAE